MGKTMKKYFAMLLVVVAIIFSACKDRYDVGSYVSTSQRDTLLADIITYIYVRPTYSEWNTRFDPQFRKYYTSQVGKFRFEKYFIDNKGIHYYYLIRPARSAKESIRGVGGMFKLNENGKIISFTEVFNTPIAALPELQQRGEELFKRMVKQGNVNDYLRHPDYIEWPDKITYYDTIQYQWLIKPEI
jgi:hypothetical protein